MDEWLLHRALWAVECCRQRIDRDQILAFLFHDIANIINLLASQLDLLESPVFAGELAQRSWDTQFCQAW
jgi:hypothetical protein